MCCEYIFTKFIDTNALYGSRRPEMKIDGRGDFRTDRVNLYLYYSNFDKHKGIKILVS